MKIEVLFFAQLAETFGMRQTIEVENGASIEAIVDGFVQQSPRLGVVRDSLAYAVNERYETSEKVLRSGDCLAILTPMSGG